MDQKPTILLECALPTKRILKSGLGRPLLLFSVKAKIMRYVIDHTKAFDRAKAIQESEEKAAISHLDANTRKYTTDIPDGKNDTLGKTSHALGAVSMMLAIAEQKLTQAESKIAELEQRQGCDLTSDQAKRIESRLSLLAEYFMDRDDTTGELECYELAALVNPENAHSYEDTIADCRDELAKG